LTGCVKVLIVDDGSTDGTSKVAFSFVKQHKIDNVRVLLLGRNHGKGEAVRKVSIEIPGYPLRLWIQIKTNWCFPFFFGGSI
jgi:glycosyltransferase involved in cell wall biosynthesis